MPIVIQNITSGDINSIFIVQRRNPVEIKDNYTHIQVGR